MSHKIAVYGLDHLVDPFDLQTGDIHLEGIAHSLSQLNRYTGHAAFPYSVAQHTCLLVGAVPYRLKRTALIHDWSESFTNDVARPVKIQLPEYREREELIQRRIFEMMREPYENLADLHEWDYRICADEMRILFPQFQEDWIEAEPLNVLITPWDWQFGKAALLKAMKEMI